MERLEELKKSLKSMTVEERIAKLAEIRDDRKVSKHAITVRAKREQDKGTALKKKFKGLSPEEQAKFLENLNASKTG